MDKKEETSLKNKLSKLLQFTKNSESSSHKGKEVQRSYSPTSILTHQTTKMKPIVSNNEKKPVKETNNIIKHYKPIINKRNPQKTQDDKILDKLKNFDNIEELEKEISRNKEKYEKLFPKEKKKPIIKQKPQYKPGSIGEQKKLEKIEEINNMITIQNTFIGKKRYNKPSSTSKPPEMYYNPKEKFCAQCLSMHLPGAHKTKNKNQYFPFN